MSGLKAEPEDLPMQTELTTGTPETQVRHAAERSAVQRPCSTFTITNRLIALRGRMVVLDASGEQLASAQARLLAWRETWDVQATQGRVRLRRKWLTLMPQWQVDGDLGEFSIRRKWAWFTRRYRIHGGPFEGLVLEGNFWDLRMDGTQDDSLVLRTRGHVLSLRDRHEVEVFDASPAAMLFAIAAMVALLADRRDKRKKDE